MQGRPHGFVSGDEMMEFYKNRLDRNNGAMGLLPQAPVGDYGMRAPSNFMPGGIGSNSSLLSRMAPVAAPLRNYNYNQPRSL